MLDEIDNLSDKRSFFRFGMIEHIFRNLYEDEYFSSKWKLSVSQLVVKFARQRKDKNLLFHPMLREYCVIGVDVMCWSELNEKYGVL